MSILLFVVGAAAFAAGAAMVGYGIPINEFSFGNTLIISGTVAIAGGLIVIGLGIAVLYLRRIADALAVRPVVRASRSPEALESTAGQARPVNPARVPFPPKRPVAAKAEAGAPERPMAELRPEPSPPPVESPVARRSNYLAPTLANPDEVAVQVEDEVSLSPQHPVASSAVESDAPVGRGTPAFFRRSEPETDAADDEPPSFEARRQPSPSSRKTPTTYFDAMWPARSKPAEPEQPKSSPEETPVEVDSAEFGRDDSDRNDAKLPDDGPAAEAASHVESAPASEQQADGDLAGPPAEEPQAVAILKSGVVDGMGYTLYVDGSIEAELPQGTLRFASINELRSHLERTS